MMESIGKLRESLKDCTNEAGVEPNRFDTYWITARACDMLIDEIEREIAERYMLLPVDADGVPIRVGDVMCSAGIREKGHKVIVSAIFEDGFVEYGSDNGLIGPLRQEDWVHVKPRTIEDVLRDLVDGIDSVEFDALTAIGEAADEIRELMEVDR